MKKCVSACCFSFLFISAFAQKDLSGIYLTEEDFNKNILSHKNSDKTRLIFHEFVEKPFITIKDQGKKTLVFKNEIFAYQKKGEILRDFNFKSYTLVEQGDIWIYSRDVNTSKAKSIRIERTYFYSLPGNKPIKELTIINLKKSFANNSLFHNFLDAQFSNDRDLTLYDQFSGKLKINHFLEQRNSALAAP